MFKNSTNLPGPSSIKIPIKIMPRFCSGLLFVVVFCGLNMELRAFASENFTSAEKSEISELIGQYIKNNPKIIIESLEGFQNEEKISEEKEQIKQLNLNKAMIEQDPDDAILGNPNGHITIVEFFDYQCGYCKRMLNILLDISENNKDIKIILKEYPILGPVSTLAAQASLAAKKQNKYAELHAALMQFRGRLSEAVIFKIANKIGIDTTVLGSDMSQPDILNHLRRTKSLGKRLIIRGTPAFIINGSISPGALNKQQLLNLIIPAQK
jgi:protein-disulfide isomerase